MYFHFIALQWSLGLRVICKPLHTTIARLSPFRLVFTVLPGFTIICNTPQECFMYYFTVDSCLTSMSPTICSAGIFNILVFIYCIVQGFSIGIATWYLIYYHISFEEKPYSLLTPGQTIWTGLVGKATPSKTAKLSLGRNIDFIQIINLHFFMDSKKSLKKL